MSILLISPYYFPNIVGGAEISSQILVEGLKKRNIPVEVLTISSSKDYCVNGLNVNTVYPNDILYRDWESNIYQKSTTFWDKIGLFYFSVFPNKSLVKKYTQFLNMRDYDIVILNSNENSFGRPSLWKACSKANVKTVMVLRDPMLIEKNFLGIKISNVYAKIVRNQIKFFDEIIAPSNYMLNLYHNKKISNSNESVIYNGVDLSMKKYVEKKDYVVYAGSVSKHKGVLTLLNAMVIVNQTRIKKIKLLIFGRGELVSILKNYDFVEYHEWIEKEKLYTYMQASKAVILPSEWDEAFGRTIVECVFSGSLPIGSDIAAIPEVLQFDEKYLFKCKDSLDLEKKISRILNLTENQYIAELSSIQKKFIAYKSDRYIDKYADIINKYLNVQ